MIDERSEADDVEEAEVEVEAPRLNLTLPTSTLRPTRPLAKNTETWRHMELPIHLSLRSMADCLSNQTFGVCQ